MKKSTVAALVFSLVGLFSSGLQNARADEQGGIGVGDQAPCVSLRDIQPDSTEITQCIRTRPANVPFLLLEFSSVMCSACQDNLPVLSKLAGEVHATAATRMILIDRSESLIRDYLKNTPKSLIHFPASLDMERKAKKAYGIFATPTLFILDQSNRVIYKHVGTLLPDDVEAIKQKVNQGL
jgi:hypothetical protein